MKRGNWVVEAVAGPDYVTPGIRHFKGGLYRAEALRLKKRWMREFTGLQIIAVRWS